MTKKYFIAVILMLVMTNTAFAHGTGQILEKVVGEYVIDFGYSEQYITTDEPVRFTFELRSNETKKDIPFTDIWIRIMQDNKLLLAGSVKTADFGTTGFSYGFQEGGEYELTARFQNEGESLAETSFPLEVLWATEKATSTGYLFSEAIIGLIIGIGVTLYFVRRKRH